MVLEVKNVCRYFGGLKAVEKVSLSLDKNQIVALIGPNGAGKTTLFNCITGMYRSTGGNITIYPDGVKPLGIEHLRPDQITAKGIARTFQNIRLFQNMTVLENVMIGRHCRLKSGILGAIFRDRKTREEEERTVDESYGILKKIGLEKHVNDLAKNLPYGEQRRLEIARALATDPFILLLDEPAAGMNPYETRELNDLIVRLRNEEDLSILLIEHDMSLVMSLAENIYVMDYGELIATGNPEQISKNRKVIEAYLGEDLSAEA